MGDFPPPFSWTKFTRSSYKQTNTVLYILYEYSIWVWFVWDIQPQSLNSPEFPVSLTTRSKLWIPDYLGSMFIHAHPPHPFVNWLQCMPKKCRIRKIVFLKIFSNTPYLRMSLIILKSTGWTCFRFWRKPEVFFFIKTSFWWIMNMNKLP